MFNSGDGESLSKLAGQWPKDIGGDGLAQARDQTGGFLSVQSTAVGGDEVRDLLKSRLADDYWLLDLKLDPGSGDKAAHVTIAAVDRPADVAPPAKLAPAALGRLVDQNITAMGDFSGVALIEVNGRRVYARSGGLADRARGTPNALDTRFGIASMGKMFTAVAVLQLVEAGKVDLDSPVGAYLKDYPNADFAKAATVRQLLTHTAGAGDFMSKRWADNIGRLRSPADYVALFGDRPPDFTPGARFSYANYGYVVLGRIIEVQSGETYGDYLATHIFKPAGMTRTGLNAVDPGSVTATRSVTPGFPLPPPPFLTAADRPTPAGGAYSTAPDLVAFATALTGHRLLDAVHTEMLFKPEVMTDDNIRTGLGFDVFVEAGTRQVGHDGGGPGENGGLRIFGDGRAVVVVLSNVAPTWRADKLCRFIAARLETR